MKKLFIALLGICALAAAGGNAFAYSGAGAYTWNAATPGYNAAATLHAGTINVSTLDMGDYLGINAGAPNAASYGASGAAVGWDDTWTGGGDANTNGDNLDGYWVQVYSNGGWWDLGAAYNQVAVMTSQDHGPYLGEGLEYRVFATNTLWDDTSLSTQKYVTDVYLDGWRTHNSAEDANGNDWLSDDIAGVYNLGGAYQYIKLVAWDPTGAYNEPEVDAVAGVVPEPSTWLLMGSGIIGMAGMAARKQKK